MILLPWSGGHKHGSPLQAPRHPPGPLSTGMFVAVKAIDKFLFNRD
jgi:hypothetical protein